MGKNDVDNRRGRKAIPLSRPSCPLCAHAGQKLIADDQSWSRGCALGDIRSQPCERHTWHSAALALLGDFVVLTSMVLANFRCGAIVRFPLNSRAIVMSHSDNHDDHSELSEMTLRVRALETVLTEKGYVDPAALDLIVEAYETRIGPRNGAKVVARAWLDPAFKKALLVDATAAVATLGHVSGVGDHLVAVENSQTLHNIVVCTLCSCYPTDLLGLPPVWYKSAPYRSRAVRDPRGVLAEFGLSLPPETELRVWDSTAETRFLVLPMRPAGTDGWNEEARIACHPRFDDRNRAGQITW
jgi:nitrile hydratase subunit alpha